MSYEDCLMKTVLLENLMRSNLVFSQGWCVATLQTPVICSKLEIRFLLPAAFYSLILHLSCGQNGNADDEFTVGAFVTASF